MTQRKTVLMLVLVLSFTCLLWSQASDLAPVVSKSVSRTIELPGEFQPFLSVALHAKLQGYVERVLVDRGSNVKRGQLLADLSAPEMKARIAEAESKVQAAESDRAQARAQLAGVESTHERLKKAAETPGAIAGNELIQSEKLVEAAQALVHSRQQAGRAAEAFLRAQKDLEAYLKITAPFDGVVTERLVHPGALVGPGADSVLLDHPAGLAFASDRRGSRGKYRRHRCRGARCRFVFPRSRSAHFRVRLRACLHTVDPKTRTMAVELDIANRDGSLSPGMYPTLKWPVRRSHPALYVPKTSVCHDHRAYFL